MNELQETFRAIVLARKWMPKANCRKMDIELFFPEVNKNYDPFVKELCQECPVVEDCLWYANATRSTSGYLGGMTPSQREEWRSKNKVTLGMTKEDYESQVMGYLQTAPDEWSSL